MAKTFAHLDRITFNPTMMVGRACIRDIRLTVSLLVNLVANGMSNDEILDAYPHVELEDIQQALYYHNSPQHGFIYTGGMR